MPRRSKGCPFKPPTPQRYPWLMISHGKSSGVTSFYSTLEKRHYMTKIPHVSDRAVCASYQGWLVVVDPDTRECMLLNLASMEQINLPRIIGSDFSNLNIAPTEETAKVIDDYMHGNCVITAPPTSANCVVGFFVDYRPSAAIWRPGQEKWTTHDFGDELGALAVCNNMIYGFTESDKFFAVCEFVDEKLVTKRIGPMPDPVNDEAVMHARAFFVGSCGDIYCVVMSPLGETTERLRYLHVCKFDPTNSTWTRMENIDNQVFFINDDSSILCPASSVGLKGNCTYYVSSRRDCNLYTYDMEDNWLHSFQACPNAINNKVSGTIFIMARVEEDESSKGSSGRRRNPADNTTLAEFQKRQERKKVGKSHEKGPEMEPEKERLVLGSSQPNPKKLDNTNLMTEKEDLRPPRNTAASKKCLEDQKLAKIEAGLKKLRDDSDQNQRMKRYVLEETKHHCLLGQPDPTDQELANLIDEKKACRTLALLKARQDARVLGTTTNEDPQASKSWERENGILRERLMSTTDWDSTSIEKVLEGRNTDLFTDNIGTMMIPKKNMDGGITVIFSIHLPGGNSTTITRNFHLTLFETSETGQNHRILTFPRISPNTQDILMSPSGYMDTSTS
ncbi:OLC1v1014623C1 [Oldenlandia corymbosa var. corymbosa]|uniref:OLC1v1014623C1 n=1 Tax=Oldenlandia corymbosa var. corymbosa TaxID=529605 RepID=A0AAV1E132_OLDCO|nr:OLC1v1014623C1 [Oldenlandia corymbosa var. corymbosa]